MADRRVFISYSHADRKWLERLKVHLRPLIRDSIADIWDDTRIKAGDAWQIEIQKALEVASVAVLLISADFLASDFVQSEELPALLKAAEERGLLILQLIVSPSRFERTPLAQLQAVNSPAEPLVNMTEYQRELLMETLAARIESAVQTENVQRLKNEVNRHGLDIQMIKVALRGIVTRFEIDYLRRLARAEPWHCRYDPDTYFRLKRLDDMGFVLPTLKEGSRRLVKIQELFGDESIPVDQRKWFDMKDYVEITEDGKKYVALYDAVSPGT